MGEKGDLRNGEYDSEGDVRRESEKEIMGISIGLLEGNGRKRMGRESE
jgi:hypothetical protein